MAAILLGLLLGLLGCGDSRGAGDGAAVAQRGVPSANATRPEQQSTLDAPRVGNLLLITIDTLRADALGFAGNPEAATPVLDRLAARGAVFSNAHAHAVITLPSHASILTGLHPYEHGIRNNSGFVLPEGIPTAATLLAAEGFATGAFVGAFPLDARFGLARGFDIYDDRYPEGSHTAENAFTMAERRGDEVVRAALEWWQAHAGERRFLWVHLFDPHAPYRPPEPFASRFPGRPYHGEVAAVDSFLAPLLEPHLEGEEEPTLIVFTADHGEGLGDHGESTHGLFAYEPTLRVPLVLWAPGLAPVRSGVWARHVDLLPTMLEAAGVDAAVELPGRSLFGDPTAERTTYFEALSPNLDRGWAPLRGAIANGRKLISLPLPELYDLEADPAESRNLFEEERERVRRLARLLPEESVWPPRGGPVSAEVERALRSLGYLGGGAPPKAEYTAEDDPKNLVELDRKVHQVIDLFQRRRLSEAAELGREVVRERPEMGLGYYYLSQVLLEEGRPAEALEVMLEAHRREVATDALLRQLALTLAEAGRLSEAVSVIAPIAERGDPDTLNALGTVLSEAGRQAEAEEALQRVFAVDPRNPVAHEQLALVALRRQEWREAEVRARRALDLHQSLPLAWNYLGAAVYNQARPREALAAWQRALVHDPRLWDALFNVAVVSREIGEVDGAREALRRFVSEAPPGQYAQDIQAARGWLAELGG
ncbi:MAG: sulfatase-like hydrolase/transferase [Thermoanaerobaculia bacterium]